jgi:ubiquinone/menaquinone biosynthesis C-methylase UbiE
VSRVNRNQAAFLPLNAPLEDIRQGVDGETVRAWFGEPVAVQHYLRAAANLGLWESEKRILSQIFEPDAPLLDVGCGAGRIALGLWRLGFRTVRGIDFCAAMVVEAQQLAAVAACPFEFEIGDATDLRFGDASFAGAVFGFNGLMQIPGRDQRRRALAELRRVTRAGGHLVFTTHDRDLERERAAWAEEATRWSTGIQSPELREFGDRVMRLPEGKVYMHLPNRGEVLADLAAAGWAHEFDELRSRIANESAAVREFSDECRFWVARAG